MQESTKRKRSARLINELRARSKQCRECVKTSFLSERIEHKDLRDALDHYFSYWDDFTHPGLFSIAFEATKGTRQGVVKPQAAMAMMAAAFDIHDDIIDGSRQKHGRATVLGRFGQGLSLLLGNAFLIRGLTLLGESVAGMPVERERVVFAAVKNCLFEVGIAHSMELSIKGDFHADADNYLHILNMKAAAVEADMHVGALIGAGTANDVEALREYGRTFGTLATLREEFVDIFDVEELNRRVSNETLPAPLILALQDAKNEERIMKILREGKLTSVQVHRLADFVLDMKPVSALKKEMKELTDRAVKLACQVQNKRSSALLRSLAISMLEDL